MRTGRPDGGLTGSTHWGLTGGIPGVNIQAFQSTLFRTSTWETQTLESPTNLLRNMKTWNDSEDKTSKCHHLHLCTILSTSRPPRTWAPIRDLNAQNLFKYLKTLLSLFLQWPAFVEVLYTLQLGWVPDVPHSLEQECQTQEGRTESTVFKKDK